MRLAIGALVAAACSSSPTPEREARPETPRLGAIDGGTAIAVTDATPAPAPVDDVVLITDRAALEVIAAEADFATRLPGWPSIAEVLAKDVRAVGKADPDAGVGVAGNSHRLFDVRWLKTGSFELIGVANRLDRAPFGGCGDVRLVYRLRYDLTRKGVRHASRLPMTLNLVYAVADDGTGCRTAAERWRPPAGLDPSAQARWLISDGALAPARLAQLTTVQVNLQQVRWPSAVRPDLGGHAEYLMRAFRPVGDRFEPQPLDNVPDVARLRKDRALRAELLAWLAEPATLDALDLGFARLPEKFLDDTAVSVAPRGLARRANRPFRQLFTAADLAELPLDGRRTIASPEAVLRRLDDATCQGCHQGRTIAGFHLLGDDAPDALAANALAVSSSAHLVDERARRAALLAVVAAGTTPDWLRPLSERAGDGDGGWGSHCGLGDPGFAGWTCGADLRCDPHDAPADDAVVGICIPDSPQVGDACEPAAVTPLADPHKDRIRKPGSRACAGDQYCNRTRVGFPGGMCTADCDALPAEGGCGAIAILTPFNNCLARAEPFETCLAENVSAAGLRACDLARPCRDDYVCVRATSGDAGVCIPPYFLFQLRVDGHP